MGERDPCGEPLPRKIRYTSVVAVVGRFLKFHILKAKSNQEHSHGRLKRVLACDKSFLVIFTDRFTMSLSLGRSETVKFVARHTQNYDSLHFNGCQDVEPL